LSLGFYGLVSAQVETLLYTHTDCTGVLVSAAFKGGSGFADEDNVLTTICTRAAVSVSVHLYALSREHEDSSLGRGWLSHMRHLELTRLMLQDGVLQVKIIVARIYIAGWKVYSLLTVLTQLLNLRIK